MEAQDTFIANTLSFCKQGNDWLSCQTIDCAPAKIKTGKTLGTPSIDCSCHNLHNEVVAMISASPDVKNTLSKVKKVMVGANNSAKNSAILKNQEALRPQLPLSHRWTGESGMIAKFDRIHDNLVVVRRSEDADFEMGESTPFKHKVSKLYSVLSTTKITTKALQSKDNKLCDIWEDLEMLISDIYEHKSNPDHKL